MSKVVGIFVDIARQFHSVSILNKDARINYERYLQEAVGNNELHRAFAYGVQIDDEAQRFINALKNMGYEPKYKQAKKIFDHKKQIDRPSIKNTNWNLGIAMDVVRHIKFLNTVVIGSNSPELVPLIEWIKEQGVKTIIYSFGIHKELRAIADHCREINDNILDIKDVGESQEPESQSTPS